jgi:hypothetical protein
MRKLENREVIDPLKPAIPAVQGGAMSAVDRKPDIRELVGIAVNTSALDSSELHERAVDRVAALGAAALEVSLGADLAG